MTASLPPDVVAYKRTPEFDEHTLPAGLRRGHSTKAGVWALIHVLDGRLRYRILDPASDTVLEPGTPGLVLPRQLHEVEPLGHVRFYVEFHAAPKTTGGPHEQPGVIGD